MRLNFLSLIILVAIVGGAVGGAYGAGVVAGRMSVAGAAQSQSAAGTQSQSPASPLATPSASMGAAMQGGFGRGLTGTVEKLEGNTLTIAVASGASTQVTLAQDTPIQRTSAASPEDLRPGVRVLVMSQAGSGGSLVASSVQILPAEGASPAQTPRSRPQGAPTSAP